VNESLTSKMGPVEKPDYCPTLACENQAKTVKSV